MSADLPVLRSRILAREGLRHAFFTRLGGTSAGEHASLSFAASTGDTPENVEKNVTVAAAALGVPPGRLFYASQVHGADVIDVGASDDRQAVLHREADAVAARAGEPVACGVRSADCATLLLADRRSGDVCAVHAGWRGTVRGIVAAAVAHLHRARGGAVELVCAIGPHIERCCFEVGEEVAAELAGCSSAGRAVVHPGPRGKPHVDLRAVLRAQLRDAGLGDADVEDVPGCTFCDPERFFSYRRQGPKSGRLLSAIVPR